MKRLIILLLSILLFNCSDLHQPTTAWNKAHYEQIDGVVEIATGWARSHLCTGSLIKENMVLTAAHCAVFPAQDLYIVYGCDDIRSSSCQRMRVKKTIVHPKYKKEFLYGNDIAILITAQPIPLKLAEISLTKEIPENLSVKAVGFGQRNGMSGILYAGRGRTARDYNYELVVFMPQALDPNPGDSGGPVLMLENGKFKIVGVLSRGQWTSTSKKDTSGRYLTVFKQSGYSIYTKPVMYLNWINEVYKENSQ